MMTRTAFLLAVLLVMGGDGANGSGLSIDYLLQQHPEELTSVKLCGSWTSEAASGFFRVLTAEFFLGGSRLWLQWMSARDSSGRTSVVATMELPVINAAHASFFFESVDCRVVEGTAVITFTADSGHSEDRFFFEIVASSVPGEGEVTHRLVDASAEASESEAASREARVPPRREHISSAEEGA